MNKTYAQAALINYGYMANGVITTDEAVEAIESKRPAAVGAGR